MTNKIIKSVLDETSPAYYFLIGIRVLVVAMMYPIICPAIDYISSIVDIFKHPIGTALDLLIGTNLIDPITPEAWKVLPYWNKVRIIFDVYWVLILLFMAIYIVVTLLSLLSRLFPGKIAKSVLQYSAILFSHLPLCVLIGFGIYRSIQFFIKSWPSDTGVFWTVLLIFAQIGIFSIWIAKVFMFYLGPILVAYYTVPTSLAFAGRESKSFTHLLNYSEW